MGKAIQAKVSDTKQVERLLGRLALQMRGKILVQGVRAAGRVAANAAKTLAPKPGYPGDKPDRKPLNQTIKVVVRDYSNGPAAVVGPQWPEGAHGHLVEFGHQLPDGSRTKPKPFLRPAADSTKTQQQSALIAKVDAGVRKEIG